MSNFQLKTPLVFIIFNRPDTTRRVFEEIAKARPSKLLVIADGARKNKPGELERVNAVRKIIDEVNWPCEILTNYLDENIGCRARVSSGLDWVFENVEEAIILEDDCLPHSTFFEFCEELLAKYRSDERIGMISGNNFQFGKKRTEDSYYFSKYNHIWGWATWRRAWKKYDVQAKIWPKFRDEGWLRNIASSPREEIFWQRAFQGVYDNKIDTWDYQLGLAFFSNGMLAITPEVNMVSNIGFGEFATHTHEKNKYSEIASVAMKFPLQHPMIVLANEGADAFVAKGQFSVPSLGKRILRKLRKIFFSA